MTLEGFLDINSENFEILFNDFFLFYFDMMSHVIREFTKQTPKERPEEARFGVVFLWRLMRIVELFPDAEIGKYITQQFIVCDLSCNRAEMV